MTTEKIVEQLLNHIDDAVNNFNKSIPAIQKQINDDLQALFKDLEVSGGRLKNTVTNLKLLGKLKNKIDDLILNSDYKDQIKNFEKAFSTVSSLQNDYFNSITKKATIPKVLEAIKNEAITSTVVSLTEAGISANVSEPIQDILRTNITTGGKYSDLLEQMRTFIVSDKEKLGALERYTKQITTDSLNQYSATYNNVVSSGLGFKWRMYVGSNLKTTRKFCLALTEKKYYHISELPDILQGHIGSHNVFINPKTGVWAGGIPGTTKENFSVNRGGYNCGHQDFGVSDVVVPKHIRMETYKRLGMVKELEKLIDAA